MEFNPEQKHPLLLRIRLHVSLLRRECNCIDEGEHIYVYQKGGNL